MGGSWCPLAARRRSGPCGRGCNSTRIPRDGAVPAAVVPLLPATMPAIAAAVPLMMLIRDDWRHPISGHSMIELANKMRQSWDQRRSLVPRRGAGPQERPETEAR